MIAQQCLKEDLRNLRLASHAVASRMDITPILFNSIFCGTLCDVSKPSSFDDFAAVQLADIASQFVFDVHLLPKCESVSVGGWYSSYDTDEEGKLAYHEMFEMATGMLLSQACCN